MSDHHCCDSVSGGPSIQPPDTQKTHNKQPKPSIIRRVLKIIRWLVPSTILVLLPKCPACLAAYIALGTGIGLSFSSANYLRIAMMILCISALLYLATRFIISSALFARWIRTSRFTRDN